MTKAFHSLKALLIQGALILGIGLILGGCVAPPAGKESEPYHKKSDYLPLGFISSVNVVGRFVVINFSNSVMPQVGDELRVFRSGRAIGTVKITEPLQTPMATADIIGGDFQRGDAVQP